MDKVAICICNYRMGEQCDYLVEHIEKTTTTPHDFYIIDMVDDPTPPFFRSKYATTILNENLQMGGGLNFAVQKAHQSGNKYKAYWFITTSMSFTDNYDFLPHLVQRLYDEPSAVIVSPALTTQSGTAWTNMKTKGGSGWRQTHGLDALATLYWADWFDEQGGYNPDLKMNWGGDMELSWKARSQGKTIWILEPARMHKIESLAYKIGRWNFTPQERNEKASAEMHRVLSAQYGENFIEKLMWECVPNGMERM